MRFEYWKAKINCPKEFERDVVNIPKFHPNFSKFHKLSVSNYSSI